MASAWVEILSHMDRMTVLSALVRDMVVAELGVLRTSLCGAHPPGSLYTQGGRVGAGLWPLVWRGDRAVGVGSLIRPSEGGWSEPGGLAPEGLSLHLTTPSQGLGGGVGHNLTSVLET